MLRSEVTKLLDTIVSIAETSSIPISVGCFGSLTTGSFRFDDSYKSDIDLFIISHDAKAEDAKIYLQPIFDATLNGNALVIDRQLTNDKPEARIARFAVTDKTSTLSVDCYVAHIDDLITGCVHEPGGSLLQRYTEPPEHRWLEPCPLMTTSGKPVLFDQGAGAILYNAAGEKRILDNGTELVLAKVCEFDKYSPCLPRVNRISGTPSTSLEDPILNGVTGEKIITLRLLYDPSNRTFGEVIAPAFTRFATDHRRQTESETQSPIVTLFSRYKRGLFTPTYTARMQSLADTAISKKAFRAEQFQWKMDEATI